MNTSVLTIYKGCLPNSSDRAAEKSGTIAKPRAYTDNPIVAWNCVQLRAVVIEPYPMAYAGPMYAAISVRRHATVVMTHLRL